MTMDAEVANPNRARMIKRILFSVGIGLIALAIAAFFFGGTADYTLLVVIAKGAGVLGFLCLAATKMYRPVPGVRRDVI